MHSVAHTAKHISDYYRISLWNVLDQNDIALVAVKRTQLSVQSISFYTRRMWLGRNT